MNRKMQRHGEKMGLLDWMYEEEGFRAWGVLYRGLVFGGILGKKEQADAVSDAAG